MALDAIKKLLESQRSGPTIAKASTPIRLLRKRIYRLYLLYKYDI